MSALVSLEGKLNKYTNVVKGWQSRYFILSSHNGSLDYHLSESEAKNCTGKPRGSLLLAGAVIAPGIDDEYTFSVNPTNGEVYKLRASSTKERQEWVCRLRAIAHHFTSQIAQEHPPLSNGRKQRSSSFKAQINDNLTKIKDQVQNTASGLVSSAPKPASSTEVPPDSYLSATSAPQSYASRPRTDSLLSIGNNPKFTESKRSLPKTMCIELANAREVLVSADNYHAGLLNVVDSMSKHEGHHKNAESISVNSEENRRQSMALDRDVLLMKATSAAMLQSLSTAYSLLHKYHQNTAPSLPPNASISWVEPRVSTVITSPSTQRSVGTVNSVASFEVPPLANPADEVADPPMEPEEDLGPVDEHKNVIMELLSQIKLGMDLTKVTLPTFILEKRSLLEMYADLLGHSDLFLAPVSGATPEERMCHVIKFYLATFNCSRKDHNAKKPYNPIIGEVFQCSYYVPKDDEHTSTSPILSESHYRIKFLSEQVSHHPPVSACFVSCPEKEIRLHSHIWTKSRFMNMTIGVNNVGESTLSLLRHNEDYVMTFPSVYARSVLTVPWSELGGRCSIVCEKTGLSASITFHTKPTYGGEPDRVTVEAKNSSGAVFCRADGKWNEVIEFTHYKIHGNSSSGEVKGQLETFDISKLPVFPKHVLPLEKQSKMESRKLWRHVTESLRRGDVASATKHKVEIERQQREVERQRQEAHRSISNNYFVVRKGKDYDAYIPAEAIE